MRKSLFSKQLFLYVGILIVSFTILGAMIYNAFSNYYISQKEKILVEQCEKIKSEYEYAYSVGIVSTTQLSKLQYEFQVFYEYLNASVILMSKSGRVEMVSQDVNQKWIGTTIAQDEITKVLSGEIVKIKGKFGGVFKEPVITIGYPIMIDQQILGAIFLNASIPEIVKTTRDIYKIIIICLFVSLFIAFVLVYFSSKTITKPIMQMNEAAKIIANGDFDKRLEFKRDDEIGQLAESFNNMAESLMQLDKVKKDFFANISHDLRSPLTSISGFLTAIIDGTVPVEKQKYYLNIILEETERLSKLANDILDLSKLQSSDIRLEETTFDINELIKKVLEQFENGIVKKNIQTEVVFAAEKSFVFADYDKIQRVLYNLLDNAIKFTDENEKIKIETTLQGEKISVSILDTGRGIEEEHLKNIFDRFFKADSSRGEDKKGSGLGLAIVKEFMKAHQEEIFVKSKVGKGTEFIFTLKLSNVYN